jgi:short-subunit dehydrogenase
MTYITSLLIPTLEKAHRALIINIGSGAETGTPYQVVYSGCKAFVASFSKALDWELKSEGFNIDVVGLVPGEVRTPAHKATLSWRVPTPQVFAKSALDRVGPGRGRHITPYFNHWGVLFMLNMLPEFVAQKAMIHGMLEMR